MNSRDVDELYERFVLRLILFSFHDIWHLTRDLHTSLKWAKAATKAPQVESASRSLNTSIELADRFQGWIAAIMRLGYQDPGQKGRGSEFGARLAELMYRIVTVCAGYTGERNRVIVNQLPPVIVDATAERLLMVPIMCAIATTDRAVAISGHASDQRMELRLSTELDKYYPAPYLQWVSLGSPAMGEQAFIGELFERLLVECHADAEATSNTEFGTSVLQIAIPVISHPRRFGLR